MENYEREFYDKMATSETMLFDRFRKKESLNGNWNYTVDQYDTCLRQRWFDEIYYDDFGNTLPVDFSFDGWDMMSLPCSWNVTDKMYLLYDGSMVYTKKFIYEKQNDDEHMILKIGAANYLCRVFINKQYVGMHRGGSTPCYFDITEFLQHDNRIIIQVDSTRRSNQVPAMNTDWFNYGGIYRDIDLFRVPKIHIKDFKIALIPDSGFKKICVSVSMSEKYSGTAKLSINELGISQNIDIVNGYGELILDAEPTLWSPENPKLYDVELSYDGDTVKDRIGFREFKVVGNDIYLNGKKRFMKGICLHEDDIKMGKCTTEASIREAIRVVKEELHGVFIRLAHYPHTRLFAKIADEMGIMLWEEIPVYWAIAFDNESTYKDAENQLGELIRRDHNRASVVIWSVGNENADTDARFRFMSSLADFAHSQDNTRAVGAACLVNEVDERIEDRLADSLDIIGINEYYGWYNPDFSKLGRVLRNSAPSKPVIITEVGAGARAGNHGTSDMLWTEEFQEEFYRKQVAEIGSCSFIKGVSPWILYDFRAERRFNSYQEGFNRKGLIDSDRKTKKLAFAVLASFYETKE